MIEVVLARQPIVNSRLAVVGYELLYRSTQATPDNVDGEQMTARVQLGAMSIGLEHLAGGKLMFCNADRGVLVGTTPITLPPSRTVVEVVETVVVDDEVVEGCRRLRRDGYRLALDDFGWAPGVERLLPLVSFVKIDFLLMTREEIVDTVRRLAPYNVSLVAEKVETDEDVAWARSRGFHLFQGYAVARPARMSRRTVSVSAVSHVRLAGTLLRRDLQFAELEELMRHDPGLVLQVLQMATSIATSWTPRRPLTLRQAMVLLGMDRLRQWIALLVLGSQHGASPDGIATALVRARTCELLAQDRLVGSADLGFTAGLVSALDVMLGVDRDEVRDALDLDADLTAVAFDDTTPLGGLVAEVRDFQARIEVDADAPCAPDLLEATGIAFAWALPHANAIQEAASRASRPPVGVR
ncbi:MAG: EAL domain-containing protein [Nocardioidaceae bacterium]|nr:EAL domain-containing protein [Nocardioidaceae bacterium]